jgi:hypothetical protein
VVLAERAGSITLIEQSFGPGGVPLGRVRHVLAGGPAAARRTAG